MNRRYLFKNLFIAASALGMWVCGEDDKCIQENDDKNIIYCRLEWDKRYEFDERALDDELASLKRDIIRLVKKNGQ